MRVTGKWISSFFILAVFVLAFTTRPADASTTGFSTFYQDNTPDSCQYCRDANVYAAPNGIVYQMPRIGETLKLNAIDAYGKKLWTYSFPKYTELEEFSFQTVGSKGNLYIGYQNDDYDHESNAGNYLASISPKGKLKWSFKLDILS